MSGRIIIAPYGYKGTMEAFEAAGAIAGVIGELRPGCSLMSLPLGDGGRGTARALVTARAGAWHRYPAHAATGEIRDVPVGRIGNEGIMEAASVAALADVPVELRHPDRLSTRGLGELIVAMARDGCRSIAIGLGDSATHDCGIGAAAAAGYRFLDADGHELEPVGGSLARIAHIDGEADPLLRGLSLRALCDVMNPLFGDAGAALLFAEQKGASGEEALRLEEGGRNLERVVLRDLGVSLDNGPGSGAAGGLGAGLAAFLGATLIGGADAVLDEVGFDRLLPGASLVVTGEGMVDRKTLLGKGAGRVASRARRAGVPCIIIAGRIDGEREALERELGARIIELGGSPAGRADALETLRGQLRRELPEHLPD